MALSISTQLGIEIFLDSGVGWCAESASDRKHSIGLHQPSSLLDRFGRRKGVVERDEVDLAAVYTASIVDHFEIGNLRFAIGGNCRDWSAIGRRRSKLDLRVGHAFVKGA